MALEAGTKLGLYEILDPIGAGGMGEVYRARDTKLGREVAIKVLPEAFAENEERLARFEREAKVLAQLNHPGIAHRSSLNFPVKSPYGSPRSVKLLIPPTCLAGEARCEAPRLS